MGVLSLKYKAHKMVNVIFYLVVFLIGFVVGLGIKKIDFNKLVSQVLMIDSVQAYTIEIQNNVEFNEEFIYNAFQKWSSNSYTIDDFKFEDNGLVSCYVRSSRYTWHCDMLITNEIQNYSSSNWNFGSGSSASPYHFISFDYNYSTSSYSYSGTSSGVTSNVSGITKRVTNFDSIENFNSLYTMNYSSYNKLDFSGYTLNLEFNENLFKDDDDFKEVCVNNYDKFAVVSNLYDEVVNDETSYKVFSDRDFIWFKNGVKGLSTFLYHNKSDDNVMILEENGIYALYGYWFWLNSKEEIDKYFTSGESSVAYMLEEKGYVNKYLYYNYTMHPFINYFNGNEEEYLFNVFWFKTQGINYLDGTFEEDVQKYCFYIKKEYDVVIYKNNEWGDIYSNITILGGTEINTSTSVNQSNVNSTGLFSNITNFVSRISAPIVFINGCVYDLYMSMPLIVRMFVLSFLTILFIKYLIDMIVR